MELYHWYYLSVFFIYWSQVIDGNVIKLNFSSTNGGLKAKDGEELKGFAVAGADQKFYWAKPW